MNLMPPAYNPIANYVIGAVIILIAISIFMTYRLCGLSHQKPIRIHPEPALTTESQSQSYSHV